MIENKSTDIEFNIPYYVLGIGNYRKTKIVFDAPFEGGGVNGAIFKAEELYTHTN